MVDDGLVAWCSLAALLWYRLREAQTSAQEHIAMQHFALLNLIACPLVPERSRLTGENQKDSSALIRLRPCDSIRRSCCAQVSARSGGFRQ